MIGAELRLLSAPLAVMSLRARFLRSAVAFGAALLAYRIVALLTVEQWNGYGERLSQVMDTSKIFSLAFAGRLVEVWAQVVGDFGQGLPLLALLGLVASYGLMVLRRVDFPRGLALLGFAALVACASPGPLLLLKDSMLDVPRMLLFLGPLMTFVSVQLVALIYSDSRQHVRVGFL